jgi:carbamate kinase
VLLVVALGGNALLRRGEPMEATNQRANIRRAAEALAPVARGNRIVVTHGNGPQVGLLALQNASYREVAPYPLDVLDAETEGMIGYVLEQELARALPGRRFATLLTQIRVDPADPAFASPTKFVGPVYAEAEVEAVRKERDWAFARDGAAWRRVVPSPEPRSIEELETIRLLVDHDVVTTCVGGGGIPVVACGAGGVTGVEAVIDKDLAAALLATELGADALLLLTDVDAVYRGWGTPEQEPIRHASASELRALGAPAGSMGPKVEAVARFVEATGGFGAIGALEAAHAVLDGRAGTAVTNGPVAGAPGGAV